MKPYYQDEYITLYCGDCLEVMPELTTIFDACITDPPCSIVACKQSITIPFEPMWKNLKNIVKDNGAICLFGSEPFSSYLRVSNIEMFKYDWVWDKVVPMEMMLFNKCPTKRHEIISVFCKNTNFYIPQIANEINAESWAQSRLKSKNYKTKNFLNQKVYNKKFPTSIISINKAAKECNNSIRVHPSQKPVALLEYLIKTYTNEGETILDFACGSGTTGVASKLLGRKCTLIEKEEKYCEIAAHRLTQGVLSFFDLKTDKIEKTRLF